MSINKYYNIAKTKLFPITRSLTGKGVRKTLNIIQKEFPKLQIKKFKSGTKVFDWNIPEEWNVTDAYVIYKYNNRIIDFKKNNLHLVGYSTPIKNLYLCSAGTHPAGGITGINGRNAAKKILGEQK